MVFKMKKLKITLVLLSTFFCISNLQLFSQNFCYDQYGNGCDDWSSYNKWVVLPEFPECSLWVNYKTRICNGEVQLFIERIWTENEFKMSTDCHIFSNMFPMWPNTNVVNYSFLRTFWEGTFSKLSYDLFVEYNSTLTEPQKEDFLCSDNNWVVKVTFFRDACEKYCYEIYNEYIPELNDTSPELHVVTTPCTLEYCCKLTDKYCYNKIWDAIQNKYVYIAQRVQERVGEESVDCSTYIGPNSGTSCPVGFTSTECLPTCITE